jgi:hypothetical protein
MDREEIIRMAKEAGLDDPHAVVHAYCELKLTDHLERFAALIAAAEREACAKFIEHDYVRQFERPWRDDLSAAIRARANHAA